MCDDAMGKIKSSNLMKEHLKMKRAFMIHVFDLTLDLTSVLDFDFSNPFKLSFHFHELIMATATHQQVRNELDTVEIFQTSVYGNIDEHHFDFPLPINREEAGPSAVMTTDGSRVQRRNLWIDSFGILNYVSLVFTILCIIPSYYLSFYC